MTTWTERLRAWTTFRFLRGGRDVPLADLITAARGGDPRSLGELFRRYGQPVRQFLACLAPDDADDLTQEVFLALPARLARYREEGRFEAWLKAIAFNVYRTRRRSAERRREESLDARGGDIGELPPLDAIGAVTREDLWAHAVLGMPQQLKEAWLLHREGYEAREIAELTGVSPGAAATRLSRARDYLARRLSASG